MADETETLERVSMQWPAELKAQVRERVGARGLTEFVIEAVETHLAGGSSREQAQAEAQEINELKWLAQQLADRAAMGGSNEERRSSLMELELPEWLSTAGWPVDIANLVRPAPLKECPNHPRYMLTDGEECRQCKLEREAQEAEAEAGPAPVAPEPEVERARVSGDDHLMRVMEMARKKGVDVASIDLKPASAIPQPDPKPPTDEEAQEAIEVMEEVVTIATTPDGICPSCQGELVDGECWTCGL